MCVMYCFRVYGDVIRVSSEGVSGCMHVPGMYKGWCMRLCNVLYEGLWRCIEGVMLKCIGTYACV